MFGVRLSYAVPSAYESLRDRALLGLSADSRRAVRFRGLVRPERTFLLRTVLRAFGELVWSSDFWGTWQQLDPVITVHPDKIFLEAFSRDQSVYGLVTLDTELFEIEGEPLYGSSNISFTAWLWAALGEMRTSRRTWLQLDTAGLDFQTVGSGGRFEKSLELPDSWVRGYLQLQQAMTLPGSRLRARAADVLGAVRFLRYSNARTSPRALRFELEPGSDARIVLEPWEEVFPLRGCQHQSERPRSVRTWGRQRLKLLEPVLPFADSVDIWIKGRAMPSFYQANLPGLSFLIGLSGGKGERWSSDDGPAFELMEMPSDPSPEGQASALALLGERHRVTVTQLGESLGIEERQSQAILTRLCRDGQAFYELATRSYRYRPLFEQPVELDRLFAPSPRLEMARAFVVEGDVEVRACLPRETRRIKRLPTGDGEKRLREVIFRDWCLEGRVGEQQTVEVTVDDNDRIIFARCGCPHFQDHLMARGPCAHMLALREVGLRERLDLPTSEEAQEP